MLKTHHWWIGLTCALLVAGCDCGGETPPDARALGDSGPRIPEDCTNGVDDDGDGRVDCDDVECSAPAYDPAGGTSFFDSVRFLFDAGAASCSGGTPQQTGADGVLASEAAVLTGFVQDEGGAGLGGVRVSALGRPELGVTQTTADGRFFFVVNAGPVVLDFTVAARLPAQRTLFAPRHQLTWAGRTILIERDAQVTEIQLGQDSMQVARGSEIEDEDGRRSATLMIPPRTEATLQMADGSSRQPSSLHVRLTEFTRGSRGVDRMPGTLPDSSGYTYAVEIDSDEGFEAGATSVRFDRPVALYVHNFLGFPVGMSVPVGSYDRQNGRWEAERDGRIVEVVSITDERADLDLDGDGRAEPEAELRRLGIEEEELVALAESYSSGAQLWRVPVEHLTPWDCNWPFGPPDGARGPGFGGSGSTNPNRDWEFSGSIVSSQGQTLGESIPVAGTGLQLHYQSGQVPGRSDNYRVSVPLGEPGLMGSVLGVSVEVDVAGVHVETREGLDLADRWSWDWDGRDVFGREVVGVTQARVRVGYRYAGEYREPSGDRPSFAAPGGTFITGNRSREEVTLWRESFVPLGVRDPRGIGLGGWTLSGHHRFDPRAFVLTRGDGSRVDYIGRVPPAEGFAGRLLMRGDSGDGGLAVDARFGHAVAILVGPDGRVYIADAAAHKVRVVEPDGTIDTFANITNPLALAFRSDGGLYVASGTDHCVRRVDPGGSISTFAGVCGVGGSPNGDGGPASSAALALPTALAVDVNDRLCIASGFFGNIRCVDPITLAIQQIAGGGAATPESASLGEANLVGLASLAFDSVGRLYASIPGRNRVYLIAADRISVFAGNGAAAPFERTGPAGASSLLAPFGLAIDPSNDDVCLSELGGDQVVCIDSSGVMRLRAGGTGSFRDGAPATEVPLIRPLPLAFGPDGVMYVGHGGDEITQIVRVAPRWPRRVDGDWWVPSEDGARLFRFSETGVHRSTVSVATSTTLVGFTYDAEGRLAVATDTDGNTLRVERTSTGAELVAPFGQRTRLFVDETGWLGSVTDPISRRWTLTYHPAAEPGRGGLLATFSTPQDATSTFSYDALGRLLSDEGADGRSLELERRFDGQTEIVTVTSAEGRVATQRLERDGDGEAQTTIEQIDGTSSVIRRPLAEEAGDLVFESSDGTSYRATSEPHPIFARATPFASSAVITLPSGASYTATRALAIDFDPLTVPPLIGAIHTTQTTPVGTSVADYDASTRTLTTTSPEGRVVLRELDSEGRLRWLRAPGLHPIEVRYDSLGRVEEVRQSDGAAELRRVRARYGPDGFLDDVTLADDSLVGLETDAIGRVRELWSGGLTTGFDYDDPLRTLTVTAPDGDDHTLLFDRSGQLTSYSAPGASPLEWTYDRDGVSTRGGVRGAAHAVVFSPDPTSGRPARITIGAEALVPTYEPSTGAMRSLAGPAGVTVHFERDGPRTEEQRWTGPVEGVVDYRMEASRPSSSTERAPMCPRSFEPPPRPTASSPIISAASGEWWTSRAAASRKPSTTTPLDASSPTARPAFSPSDSPEESTIPTPASSASAPATMTPTSDSGPRATRFISTEGTRTSTRMSVATPSTSSIRAASSPTPCSTQASSPMTSTRSRATTYLAAATTSARTSAPSGWMPSDCSSPWPPASALATAVCGPLVVRGLARGEQGAQPTISSSTTRTRPALGVSRRAV